MPAGIVSVEPVIGLEIHVELRSRTKMFSRAPNPAHPDFDDFAASHPNSLIDPLVLALPGSLPVLNLAAIDMAIRVGLALGCRIADLSRWDRKAYFYPDLPKGYQISQHNLPLCGPGLVRLPPTDPAGFFLPDAPDHLWRSIRILRAHLEEDAGKLLHEAPGGLPLDHSIVDLNRAGTPLLEIVTAPDFSSADQVVAFARFLRDLCRTLHVSEGVMQKGHIRFEPNINAVLTLADDRRVATPVVEVKNLNSFRSLRAAVEFELREQPARFLADALEMGPGRKTTRGWDDARGVTFLQRDKEDAHDYRYFPDPDLLPFRPDPAHLRRLADSLPELPLSRLRRYVADFALDPRQAAALAAEPADAAFFDACTDLLASPAPASPAIDRPLAARLAANLLLQSGARRANERAVQLALLGISPAQVAAIARLREHGLIGNAAADELFGLCCDPARAGADPAALARDRGMLIVRDDAALDAWCHAAIAQQPQAASDVRAGKDAALGRLVGTVMKLSAGKADAQAARARLLAILRPS